MTPDEQRRLTSWLTEDLSEHTVTQLHRIAALEVVGDSHPDPGIASLARNQGRRAREILTRRGRR